MNNIKVDADIQAKLTTHVHTSPEGRKVLKTAIVLEDSANFVLLRKDGTVLATIAAFDFGAGAGNVDVIIDPKEQQCTFMAWYDGARVVHAPVTTETTAHAVDIRPRVK